MTVSDWRLMRDVELKVQTTVYTSCSEAHRRKVTASPTVPTSFLCVQATALGIWRHFSDVGAARKAPQILPLLCPTPGPVASCPGPGSHRPGCCAERGNVLLRMLHGCWGCCLALGLLLLLSWFLDPRVQGQPVIRALKGSQANLSVPDLLGSYQELTWFFWSGRSISKIVVWDSETTHYYQSQLRDRVCLSNSTLHFWGLRASDSRNYTLRVLRLDGTQEERTLRLQVLDPVAKPSIIVQDLRLKDSYCLFNLTCVVSSPLATLNISWKGSTGSPTSVLPGTVLKVATKEMPMTYTCEANDTLSSRTSSVTFMHCAALSSGKLVRATWLLVLVPLILQALLS